MHPLLIYQTENTKLNMLKKILKSFDRRKGETGASKT